MLNIINFTIILNYGLTKSVKCAILYINYIIIDMLRHILEVFFLNIAICDDETKFLEKLHRDLIELQNLDNEFVINEFDSGEELVKSYHANVYDIIFLDIEMKELNGMDTASFIRKLDKKVTIVFLTNYEKFAVKGYEVGAFRYVLKDQPIQMYKQQLDDIIKFVRCLHSDIAVNSNGKTQKISAADIIYIDICNHTVNLHMINTNIEFKGKIRDIERQVSGLNFVKIDLSCIVNIEKIKSISDQQITLDGAERPIVLYASRKYIKEIRVKFLESFKRRFG